ncbi:MAG: MBL fold metallo-hydrolase [Clostridia bacterium]|nr:MBL fold metallo-hydrolase [Clostridia bacterium]
MIIKTLTENTTENCNLKSEHGLSLYIETEKHKILFDMGQTDLFYKNAQTLGVDLGEVDVAVLSHGHYDHGGGLEKFFEINKTAFVYLSRFAFGEYYNGTEKYIGLDESLKNNPRLIFAQDEKIIDSELSLFSLNNEIKKEKIEPFGLNQKIGENFSHDAFRHEHYLVINENGKKTVISGCSHKGVVSIANALDPDVLVGGFHYSKIDPDSGILDKRAEELLKTKATFFTCHCTGEEQYKYMKKIMQNRLHYLHTGTVINL